MSRYLPIPDPVQHLIRQQAGVLAREQALALGLSQKRVDRYLREGHWSRLAPGIYLTMTTVPGWFSLAWAGVLIAPDGAALSGTAAAHLWKMVEAPTPISIRLAPGTQVRRHLPHWDFVRTRRTFRSIGQLPRLTAEDTVLDLCASSPERSAHWVTRAVGQRITHPQRLLRELRGLSRHPARRQLMELLADVDQGAQSPLELRYLRSVERAHDLPIGRRQKRSGKYRIDVHYAQGLIVELDGTLGHTGTDLFRDMDRDNYHVLRGVITLRFGWQQCLESPCAVAAAVAQALRNLGWDGVPSRCRACGTAPSGFMIV